MINGYRLMVTNTALAVTAALKTAPSVTILHKPMNTIAVMV
jgi:hypothetical protein